MYNNYKLLPLLIESCQHCCLFVFWYFLSFIVYCRTTHTYCTYMKTDNPLLSVNKTIKEIYSIQLHSYRCTTVVTCPQLATVTVLAIKSSLQNWSFEPDKFVTAVREDVPICERGGNATYWYPPETSDTSASLVCWLWSLPACCGETLPGCSTLLAAPPSDAGALLWWWQDRSAVNMHLPALWSVESDWCSP